MCRDNNASYLIEYYFYTYTIITIYFSTRSQLSRKYINNYSNSTRYTIINLVYVTYTMFVTIYISYTRVINYTDSNNTYRLYLYFNTNTSILRAIQ